MANGGAADEHPVALPDRYDRAFAGSLLVVVENRWRRRIGSRYVRAPIMEKEFIVDRSEVLARDQRRMRAHDWTMAMALCMGMVGLALFFLIIWL